MSIREWLKRAEDRRRAERLRPADLMVYYWTGARPEPRKVSDLGPYGARIIAPAGFYPGTLVVLAFTRQNAPEISGVPGDISVCGKVTRNEEDGFCVEFQFGSTAERRSFRTFFYELKRSTRNATDVQTPPKVRRAGSD
jgi:hypothetical protein